MREYPVFIPCFHKDGAAVFTDVYISQSVCACVFLRELNPFFSFSFPITQTTGFSFSFITGGVFL